MAAILVVEVVVVVVWSFNDSTNTTALAVFKLSTRPELLAVGVRQTDQN